MTGTNVRIPFRKQVVRCELTFPVYTRKYKPSSGGSANLPILIQNFYWTQICVILLQCYKFVTFTLTVCFRRCKGKFKEYASIIFNSGTVFPSNSGYIDPPSERIKAKQSLYSCSLIRKRDLDRGRFFEPKVRKAI